ncbi:MAG: lysyl oxidase family protein [Chitinophagales bacterium]
MRRFVQLLLLTNILFLATPFFTLACEVDEVEVSIIIDPDSWPSETSWEIKDADGVTVADGTYYDADVCVLSGVCHTFYLYDSYGDGIYTPHGVEVYYGGVLVADFSGDFGSITSVNMGCAPGEVCSSAFVVDLGTHTAEGPNTWYEFTPADTGSYVISTCDLDNICNTTIWVYDHCEGLVPSEFAEGTTAYNEDACSELAEVSTIFLAGKTYYIRIGDNGTSCDGTEIHWSLTYLGPPVGCTDAYACNYDPLAMADDGSCLYPGSPDCPSGPDLVIDSTYFDGYPATGWSADFDVSTYNAGWDDCAVEEECITGTGLRYVLQFTMKIDNIGDEDYHIGEPGGGAPGFVYSSCHGHWHYADYGEYLLYDSLGNELPVGHKNGYAVMDVGCFDGTGGYGGWDMGISAGCYDLYGNGTTCQWIDLTDVEDGTYTMVARVNWENHPDVDGRTETNLANNWVSTCIKITREEPGGEPEVEVVDDCAPYYDCYGEIFGAAEYDCNGICNGPGLIGDLNVDTLQNFDDVDTYITEILDNTILAASCNDANADSDIDVYDAALVSGCSWEGLGSTHIVSLCDMPYTFTDVYDTVTFSIGEVNTLAGYLDINSLNPTAKVLGYQFTMSGLIIDSVLNLAAETFDYNYKINHSENEVIALGYNEVSYGKKIVPSKIARVYFHSDYASDICIDYITTIVNEDYHEVITAKDDACVTITGVNEIWKNNYLDVKVVPNPFNTVTNITFNNYLQEAFSLKVFSLDGNFIFDEQTTSGSTFKFDATQLPAGVYIYELTSASVSFTGRLIKQ